MTPLSLGMIAAASLGLSVIGTRGMIAIALRRGVLDVPNARSSHTIPTPRGGGLAIVLVVLIAEILLCAAGILDRATSAALTIGGAAVAAAGAWDDVRSLPPRVRLAVQFLAASAAVGALAFVPIAPLQSASPIARIIGFVVAVTGTVWLTNLYNFMDGTDGIAGAQGVVAGIGAALLFHRAGQPGLAAVGIVIAGTSAGFLVFNWAPARIFMGDVGSGFLGFTFAILALAGDRRGGVSLLWTLLPLSPFIADATITLIRRALHGDHVATAHREHLYQRLVQHGASHRAVALTYTAAAAVLVVIAGVAASQ